jgi:Alpha/beta hydrolase domain
MTNSGPENSGSRAVIHLAARLKPSFISTFWIAYLSIGILFGASPVVTGPIAAKAAPGDPTHNYPFFSALDDVKARGYVEEEYFYSGTANRYDTPEGATGKVIDGTHTYRTRLLVRRPVDPKKFNGTVVLEWNNVTSGHDLDIDWYQIHDYLMRSGYAWVGVTAQRIGVEALKVWNKDRYASLDVTADGAIANDALSYDIFSDAGRAAREPHGADVLGGLKPRRVFATGHSQSAARLAIYVNSVHPLDPVFDAVILHGGGLKIRTDLKVKVWKLLSETDVVIGQGAVRQPDSDNFRSWEVAGDSHVDTQFIASRAKLVSRDGNPIAPGFTPGVRGGGNSPAPAPQSAEAKRFAEAIAAGASPCDQPPYSDVPFYHVMAASLDHLVAWVKDGKAPPTAPRIDITSAGPPAVIARDANGNSSGGGIRLAAIAVPIAVNTGQNTGPGFCWLYGSHADFDSAKLASLYPTHADYVRAVRKVTEENYKAGYILRPEADATIAAAERSAIGRR